MLWSRSTLLAIQSWDLSDYLKAEAKESQLGDFSHSRWILENPVVMSWLLHSMQPEIRCSLLLLNNWIVYSREGNDAQVLNLKKGS